LEQPLSLHRRGALKNRHTQFVIDGEAVVLGVDAVSDFNGLHSRQHDEEVQLYAFDILALDGEDLSMRKTNLAHCCAAVPTASLSRRSSRRDWAGPLQAHGVEARRSFLPRRALHALDQVKNRKHPAFSRVRDRF